MNLHKFLKCRLVRQYICDDRAEQVRPDPKSWDRQESTLWGLLIIVPWCQVCCPEFLGTFNNSVTRATEPVYAVSRCLERRKAMIQKENSFSDTIVVRSKTEPVGWSSAEAFFWKEEACFPGRHTRWEVFSRRDKGQEANKTDKYWKYDLFSWEAYQALMAFSHPAKFFRWRKGPIPALKDLEVERDRLN